MNIPSNLKYSNDHEWCRVEGEFAYVGITDFAQSQLGDIVFVDVPTVGEVVGAHENTTKELQYWTDISAKFLSKVTKKSLKDVEKELCYDNYMSASEAKKFGIIDKVEVVLA